MSKNPLNFGVSGIFGRMGQNPSINALTNANALAQQQLAQQNIQPLGSGTTYKPDMSQQVMTGSFDPLTQQVGMGIFGDQNARNMAVRGSGLMMHGDKFRDRAKKLSEGSEQGDYDYDNPKVVKLLEKAREADESHEGSVAKHKAGELGAHDSMSNDEYVKHYREHPDHQSPAKNTEEKPHGTYGDQGLIKSYKNASGKYVAIDGSVHDAYEDERIASSQALTKAKKKAREARRNK